MSAPTVHRLSRTALGLYNLGQPSFCAVDRTLFQEGRKLTLISTGIFYSAFAMHPLCLDDDDAGFRSPARECLRFV